MTNNLTKLILAEICSLNKVLEQVFGYKILNEEGCLERQYPLGTNYFTILEANANKLEQIDNNKLLELIIQYYVKTKYFFDCIKANNELIDEYNELQTKEEKLEADKYLIEFKEQYLKPTFLELSYCFDIINRIEK